MSTPPDDRKWESSLLYSAGNWRPPGSSGLLPTPLSRPASALKPGPGAQQPRAWSSASSGGWGDRPAPPVSPPAFHACMCAHMHVNMVDRCPLHIRRGDGTRLVVIPIRVPDC